MVILEYQEAWQVATNFLQGSTDNAHGDQCWRYDLLQQRMDQRMEPLSMEGAMQLLQEVAQQGSGSRTQWSIVYNYLEGEMMIVMGQNYDQPYRIPFDPPNSAFK
jgi:hypothetical protein